MDCCLAGDKDNCGDGRLRPPIKSLFLNGSGMVWVAAIVLAVVLSAGPAFGQFLITPMKLNIQAPPGRLYDTILKFSSTDPNAIHTIDLYLVDLTQWEDSSWRIIEPNSADPNDANFDRSKLSSCIDWISIDRKTIELSPLGIYELGLKLRVPRGIRGFYAAGIMASLRPRPEKIQGIAVVVRFLVPVLVEVQGRPMRHDVGYKDVGLEALASTGKYPATTLVSVNVANNGGTYSNLKVFTRLRGFLGGHWRQITETEFPGANIMPGVELNLRSSVERALPAGKYRINGVLYVDGRRSRMFDKEIDFAGHPGVKDVAGDAPLILEPSEVFISALPGATRTAALRVFNGSDETVNVQASLALPDSLYNVTFGDVRGEDLNCAEWVQVVPDRFTLTSGGQQTVRVSAAMPSFAAVHPCYYSVLRLQSTYADGQNAGLATTYTCISNSNITASPVAHIQKLTLAAARPSEYLIAVRGGNFGSIHFTPKCRVAVVEPDTGRSRIRTMLSSNRLGLMLPFEARDFSEILDFSSVPAGLYRVVAALEFAPDQMATRQMAIRVTGEGPGQRFVEIMQLEEELAQKIEVRW